MEKVAAKRRAAAADDSKEDRISKLPEEILSHILCFLNLKPAAKTCVLSEAWRYVWCSRPKLEFIQNRNLSLSAVDKILQSYHDRNLRLEKFSLWISEGNELEADSLLNKWIPILIQDMGVKTFHLSFMNQISRAQVFELPSLSLILESDSIQNLDLGRCMLTSTKHDLRRLQSLCLSDVSIPERILDSILSDCPFIEKVSLSDCRGFKRIKLSKTNKLTNFSFRGVDGSDVGIEIGNDVQTLGAIGMSNCLLSVSHNKPFEFSRLTRLSLTRVKLVSSESFSCNLHSLEELMLDQCSGIEEFNMSSRSMKRLSIHNISKPFRVTVNAPSIVSFNYEGILPQSISFATTSSDDHLWKSKINLGPSSDHEPSRCFNELYGLLDTLSQSEISLELDQIEIRRLWGQLSMGVSEPEQQLPVVVEHLSIKRREEKMHHSAAPVLKRLFQMFRPSFIYMGRDMLSNSSKEHREIAELLFKERKTRHSYFWQRALEGVSLQVKYRNQSEWQLVKYTGFTEVSKEGAYRGLELRIQLKWRD